jgi:hypothetical protein
MPVWDRILRHAQDVWFDKLTVLAFWPSPALPVTVQNLVKAPPSYDGKGRTAVRPYDRLYAATGFTNH